MSSFKKTAIAFSPLATPTNTERSFWKKNFKSEQHIQMEEKGPEIFLLGTLCPYMKGLGRKEMFKTAIERIFQTIRFGFWLRQEAKPKFRRIPKKAKF